MSPSTSASSRTPPAQPGPWWKQGRHEATTNGVSQSSVAQHWAEGSSSSSPSENSSSLKATATQKSHIRFVSSDDLDGKLAVKQSSYSEIYCSSHKKVGRRGVALSEEASKAVGGIFERNTEYSNKIEDLITLIHVHSAIYLSAES